MRNAIYPRARASLRLAVTCAMFLVAVTVALPLAQAPRIVLVDQEPQHRVVFRNAILAVLDVRLPPGYVSLFHTHPNDNVSVRIATGPMRIDTLETTGTVQTALVGRVAFNVGTPPYTHRVANVGPDPIHIIDVEILAREPTPVSPLAPDQLAGHDVIVDNERVRISRITLGPTEHLTNHTHPRGWLTVTVHGWPGPGEFTWTNGGTETRPIEGGPTGTERVEIQVK